MMGRWMDGLNSCELAWRFLFDDGFYEGLYSLGSCGNHLNVFKADTGLARRFFGNSITEEECLLFSKESIISSYGKFEANSSSRLSRLTRTCL